MAATHQPVVSVDWLKGQLESDSKPIVLDVTWYSAKDAYQDYLQKHIPGASFFDIMKNVQNSELFPRNIPETEFFQKQAREVGINTDSHVVVYDGTEQCGFFIGGRAWWLFKLFGHERVSVLDGGLQAWEAGGNPVTTSIPLIKEGNFLALFKPNMMQTFENMAANLNEKHNQVCDTRPAEKYRGNSENLRTGHYPGAVNMTMAAVLLDQDTKLLKTQDQLKEVFNKRGIDLSRPIVGMCNSGMSSCVAAIAASLCGAKEVSVYLGGFTEWSKKAAENQIEQSTS